MNVYSPTRQDTQEVASESKNTATSGSAVEGRVTETRLKALEKESHEYLDSLHEEVMHSTWRGRLQRLLGVEKLSLWGWQRQIPVHRRWQLVLQQNSQLRNFLNDPLLLKQAPHMTVLDIGCGFGMYWPILREYGFRKFVGIDLFDRRGQQSYLEGAQKYVAKFCPDCETQLIMDDVRNLDRHTLIFPKFDIILSIATTSRKLGSTGIPQTLVEKLVEQYGTAACIAAHVEKAH